MSENAATKPADNASSAKSKADMGFNFQPLFTVTPRERPGDASGRDAACNIGPMPNKEEG
jgi:hypothetical protein